MTFRPTVPADVPLLCRLTAETGVFKPHELAMLEETVFAEYFELYEADGHVCQTFERDGEALGFVYFALADGTFDTWELWWIVVRKDVQSRGLGGEMLRAVEDQIRERRGRVVFVETGSQPSYEPTRSFYLKQGYERHAELKDFYAVGDSQVIFRKEL